MSLQCCLNFDCSMVHWMPIIVATIAVSACSSSPIQDRTSEFSCCDPTVKYSHDPSCDELWNSNEMNFAEIDGETKTCESPCKEINHDGIILDRCVNVTVNTVCPVNGVIMETRVTFYGQVCSLGLTNGSTTGNKISVLLLLLAFLTGRLLRLLS